MADRDTVLKWMGICSQYHVRFDDCKKCPYYGGRCVDSLLRDALEVFQKETEEPRVLAWEELWSEGHPDVLWIEDPHYSNELMRVEYDDEWLKSENTPVYQTHDYLHYWFCEDDEVKQNYDRYDRTYKFRAWSKEPTERQRKAVEWGDYYD